MWIMWITSWKNILNAINRKKSDAENLNSSVDKLCPETKNILLKM